MFSAFVLMFSILIGSVTKANPALDGRIIGGTPANILSFPYQVSLQNHEGHLCGGSIIHRNFILTAAHCLAGESPKTLKIRAGSHFHNNGGVVIRVCRATTHEKYVKYDYDIAILKLCQNLPFSDKVLPIALPKVNEGIQDGSSGVVIGWGRADDNRFPLRLQRLTVVIRNQTTCRKSYKSFGNVTKRMLCAGCPKDICDSCDGDSGGPLTIRGIQVGIVSWGYGCANKDYPGVYTRVAPFRKWIENKIKTG